ncbi:MAG TPA: esterase-like activity of phytase family protein [Rhizomicrobium sp.]|jgi:hypothetical protein
MRPPAVVSLAAAILAVSADAAFGAASTPPDAVTLSAKSIPLSSADLKETRVGELVYRGGLEVASPDARFGGWSGLAVSADGSRLLSQSDEGHWLRATLSYDKMGRLAGIGEAQLADMQNLDGGKPMPKQEGDAEGLTALSDNGLDGAVAISFERDHRIWRYDLSRSLDVKPSAVPAPDAIKTLESNSGLEALTMLKPHSLLAIAETGQAANGDMPAWLLAYDGKEAGVEYGALSVKPHAPYEISDAAMSPDGRDLYLLERHYFDPIRGVVAAVRRIDAASVKAGARLEGEEIAEFTMHENIDNMEGLALRRSADGKTLLYMISDDNYNHTLQRTVLLMFEVAPAQ